MYIGETTRLINSSTNNSSLQDMQMPNLLLSKPSRNGRSNDHLETLKRRLDLWKERELIDFLTEGETIQKLLNETKSIKTIVKLSKNLKTTSRRVMLMKH